jgi:SSS family solute:Na+ symporter
MTVTLGLLALYCIVQVLIGLWIGRVVRGTADFFVAGRRLNAPLVFATLLAANIGAGSTQGAAGLGYRDGLSAWWWVGSAGLGSLILARWIGPAIRSIAGTHDLRTVGDYLELRYSRGVRGAVSVLLWLGTLSILAGQLIALGGIVNVLTGLPRWAGTLVGGAVMATYFTAGGLLTSAWVNAVQLVVLLAGFIVALALALSDVGGLDVLRSRTAAIPSYWSFWEGGASGWRYLFLLGPAFFVSPGLLQKIYGARDGRAVRIGVAANGVVLLAFAFLPPLLGMIARAHHPALPNPELALPTLMSRNMPPYLGALGLAALVSAEISTCDAILFMLSTSLSQDLYKRFVRPDASDRQVLRVARLAAVAGAAGGILLAMVTPSITAALGIFYALLTVSLFVPIVAGLFVARFGTVQAAIAIAAGMVTLLVAHLAVGAGGLRGWTPTMLGLGASIAAGGAAMIVARRPREINP